MASLSFLLRDLKLIQEDGGIYRGRMREILISAEEAVNSSIAYPGIFMCYCVLQRILRLCVNMSISNAVL